MQEMIDELPEPDELPPADEDSPADKAGPGRQTPRLLEVQQRI
jgi:hypothetical protein